MDRDKPFPVRLFAAIRYALPEPAVQQLIGLPAELNDGMLGTPLPWPDVIVLEEQAEGDVFLTRFTREGEFGGDTWHMNVDDAKAQAEFEYGDALGDWKLIPSLVADARQFAVAAIQPIQQSLGRD